MHLPTSEPVLSQKTLINLLLSIPCEIHLVVGLDAHYIEPSFGLPASKRMRSLALAEDLIWPWYTGIPLRKNPRQCMHEWRGLPHQDLNTASVNTRLDNNKILFTPRRVC